jgi:hypothetical protein
MGRLHREDGPARIWGDGTKEWWLQSDYFSSKEKWWNRLSNESKLKAILNGEMP